MILRKRAERGFTLIELLMVCAIIVIVSAIILSNNTQYGGQVLLQNFAYDTALSIRQAQVYGISVARYGSGASSNFSYGYGMHFDTSSVANATALDLFADVNGNGIYDGTVGCPQTPTPGGEFVECSSINRGYYVSQLCAPAGAGLSCTGGTTVSKLDIVFIRPEPDAWISAGNTGSEPSCVPSTGANCIASARIILRSPRGDKMSVTVQANGQIAVDQTTFIAP